MITSPLKMKTFPGPPLLAQAVAVFYSTGWNDTCHTASCLFRGCAGLFPQQCFLLRSLQDPCILLQDFQLDFKGLVLTKNFPSDPGLALLIPEELVPVVEQLVSTSTTNSVNASVDRLRCLSHQENLQKAALLCGQSAPRR